MNNRLQYSTGFPAVSKAETAIRYTGTVAVLILYNTLLIPVGLYCVTQYNIIGQFICCLQCPYKNSPLRKFPRPFSAGPSPSGQRCIFQSQSGYFYSAWLTRGIGFYPWFSENPGANVSVYAMQ
jgi:hypothetical protein